MFLKKGNRGENVKYLQYGLNIMCCGTNGIDGIYGQGTVDAVKKFQRRFNLGSDGIVGNGTWNKLCSEIRKVQQALKNKGYLSSVDGVAGSGTFNAVKKFQRDHNLSADGMVGQGTWNALNGSSGGGSSSDGLLRVGSRGEDVETLQMTLKLRGYSIGQSGADGIFGAGTEKAVKDFQRDHNLSADGIVGPATQEALHHDYSGYTEYGDLLRVGSRGPAVADIQNLLNKAGYNVGSSGVDGIFGAGTEKAVRKFQADHNLSADGIVGPATKKELKKGGSSSSGLLRMGSKGEEVRRLQQALINRGYNVGKYGADGAFGQGTYNAVQRFQSDHNLSADGIVGPNTWAALGNGTGDTFGGLLRIGSKGEEVRRLQQALISKGYSVGKYGADGAFGQGTYNAVQRFQSDHNLSADGIVGPNTWAALGYVVDDYQAITGNGSGVRKFLEVAKSQLGYHEGSGNNSKYGAWFGLNYAPWCAMFVSWCANQAGILNSLVPNYCLCSLGVQWYRNKGRYISRTTKVYTPQPGDVIFFYNPNEATPYYHTGIVEYVEGNTVHTIEGNAGDMVCRKSYSRDDWRIGGYGRNGGIRSFSEKEIAEAQSNIGFAKVLGVSFKKDVETIELSRGQFNVTIKTGFTSTIGNPDGKITFSKGEIGVETSNSSCGLSANFIRQNIFNLTSNGMSFSEIKQIFNNSTIKFQVDSIKPAKITLETETKIFSDQLTVYQCVELEIMNDDFNKDYHTDAEVELYGLVGTILTGFTSVATQVTEMFKALQGDLLTILKTLIDFIRALPPIPL